VEYKIKTTFEEFIKRVKNKAKSLGAHNYCESYELLLPFEKQAIKLKYDAVNQFCFMSKGEYEQQLTDYEDAYMGGDAKPGDLMWFDGECLCCESTVDNWFLQTMSEAEGKHLDWEQVADWVKEEIVIDEFERYREQKL
jgi:hypothetical protein